MSERFNIVKGQPAQQAFPWGMGAKKDLGMGFSMFCPREKWGESQKTKEEIPVPLTFFALQPPTEMLATQAK